MRGDAGRNVDREGGSGAVGGTDRVRDDDAVTGGIIRGGAADGVAGRRGTADAGAILLPLIVQRGARGGNAEGCGAALRHRLIRGLSGDEGQSCHGDGAVHGQVAGVPGQTAAQGRQRNRGERTGIAGGGKQCEGVTGGECAASGGNRQGATIGHGAQALDQITGEGAAGFVKRKGGVARERQRVADGERADGIVTGRQRAAALHGGCTVDGAGAAERGGALHGHRVGAERTIQLQGAGADGSGPGARVRAGQLQQAGSGLGEAARAINRAAHQQADGGTAIGDTEGASIDHIDIAPDKRVGGRAINVIGRGDGADFACAGDAAAGHGQTADIIFMVELEGAVIDDRRAATGVSAETMRGGEFSGRAAVDSEQARTNSARRVPAGNGRDQFAGINDGAARIAVMGGQSQRAAAVLGQATGAIDGCAEGAAAVHHKRRTVRQPDIVSTGDGVTAAAGGVEGDARGRYIIGEGDGAVGGGVHPERGHVAVIPAEVIGAIEPGGEVGAPDPAAVLRIG